MNGAEPLYSVATPLFFLLMAAEAFAARRRGQRVFRRSDTWADLAMGVGNRIIEVGWVFVEVAVLSRLHRLAPWDLRSTWVSWAVALIGVDFVYYWYHRTHHEVRVLWASHVVHHSSEEYNLAVALRQPWLVMTWLPFLMPLALLGVPVKVLAISYAINLFFQFWIHTRVVGRLPRWFEFVCNTPSHHRVHHGSNPQYLDRNYAGILMVWDRMFGTFEPEGEAVVFGLTKNIHTTNPFAIATHELRAIARDVRAASTAGDKIRHLVKGPGWQPARGGLQLAAPAHPSEVGAH